MSEHTPGPWKVDDDNVADAIPGDESDDEGRTIVSRPCYTSITSENGSWYGLANVVVRMSGDSKDSTAGRANAQLIAAAPAMAAMLLDIYHSRTTTHGERMRIGNILVTAGVL